MAQNITLLGATYSDVPAVELPKTGGGTASFTDVTDTTAAAEDVASGKYFYSAAGVRTAGTGSGGGGGVTITALTATLPAAGWSNNTQTVTVEGATADNVILVTYAPESKSAYVSADVSCTVQAVDSLTFSCTTTPSVDIIANVMVIDGAVTPVPPVTTYSISGVSHAYKTCTQSGRYYEVSDEITEAAEGETVYISVSSAIRRISSSPSVTFTYVGMKSGTSGALGIYSFVMPASNITITLSER